MKRIIEPDEIELEFSKLFPRLVLASSSPNRKLMLSISGSEVITFNPQIDEKRENMDAEEALMSIAKAKLDSYLTSSSFLPSLPAIAADTMVLIDGKLLGKSKTRAEAKEVLSTLSGRKQIVITSSALYLPETEIQIVLDKAEVKFKRLSEYDIEEYLNTGEWIGAAGSYRIQKTGYTLIDQVKGDWTTVVGLPMKKLIEVTLHNVQSQS